MNASFPIHHALHVAQGNARASAEALALDARRAAVALGFDSHGLRDVLSVDEPMAAAIIAGSARIPPDSPLAKRTLLLVRLQRALGDVYGSTEHMDRWLDAEEPALKARPRELIRTADGLRRVLDHLEPRCKDCLR